MSSFIQAHYLTSYGASLLNRDDSGFAKRVTFGDHVRLRISSACLKRRWRESLMDMDDTSLPTGVRSTSIFERLVLPAVLENGIEESRARAGLHALIGTIVKNKRDAGTSALLETKQPLFLGNREVRMIVDAVSRVLSADGDAAALVKDSLTAPGKLMPKKNLANMFGLDDSLAYGIETALFGRFVTSDVIARTDSSVSVAHATSVHAAKPEFDFFTVVDDLAGDASGADHLGESELAAGLYYSYLCIDVPGLVANLTGCNPKAWKAQDLTGARHVIGLVLELAAIKSPGAKKGSTAPYARSDFVLLEAGNREPRQLANAYLKPPKAGDGDLMERSIKAMATHLRGHDHMYGVDTARSYASTYEGLAIPQAVDGLPLRDAIASAIDVAFELA